MADIDPMTDGRPQRLMTTREVAQALNVSQDYVRIRCADGRWECLVMEYRQGPRYLFTVAQYQKVLADSLKPAKRKTAPKPRGRPAKTTTAKTTAKRRRT